MFENISLALRSVWNHKLRSFLTMLGIIIGIASIITIVSTIKGTNDQIKQNLIGAGTNVVTVRPYRDDYSLDFSYETPPEAIAVISEQTRASIEELSSVTSASLYCERPYAESVYYRETAFSGSVCGIDKYYLDTCGYRLCCGRGMTEEDYSKCKKVLLIDTKAAESLFAGKNPVGASIEIKDEVFTVIGVVEKSSEFKPVIENLNDYYLYTDMSSGRMFMPLSVWSIPFRFDEPQSVAVRATGTDAMTAAGKAVADLLTDSQIRGSDTGLSYRSEDLLEQAEQLQTMSASTNRQLIWIACISLLVGGIGVMNIMLVSVTERTSEIGLKKAIGAKKRRILRQFLTEAAVLTTLGGILGIAAGIGLAQLLSTVMKTPTAISIPAILIAALFSTVIGVVFGLLPATKAANMNPIDALRRE